MLKKPAEKGLINLHMLRRSRKYVIVLVPLAEAKKKKKKEHVTSINF